MSWKILENSSGKATLIYFISFLFLITREPWLSGQGSMPITNSLLSTAVRIQLETKALNYNIEKGLSESQAYLLATRIIVIYI